MSCSIYLARSLFVRRFHHRALRLDLPPRPAMDLPHLLVVDNLGVFRLCLPCRRCVSNKLVFNVDLILH
jgi:hypothetical protein